MHVVLSVLGSHLDRLVEGILKAAGAEGVIHQNALHGLVATCELAAYHS